MAIPVAAGPGGTRKDKIGKRLQQAERLHKRVTIQFKRERDCLGCEITDEGNGFDRQGYIKLKRERAFAMHGRGIAMSNTKSFDGIGYFGKGNQVTATAGLLPNLYKRNQII